jgi:hypothetical protein
LDPEVTVVKASGSCCRVKWQALLAIVGIAGLIAIGYVPPASADTRTRELVLMEVDGDPDIPSGTMREPAQGQAPDPCERRSPLARRAAYDQSLRVEGTSHLVPGLRALEWRLRLRLWNLARNMTWILR